jgi:hypothetical protein
MAAETNGRLQIQGFANGQLGNAQETPNPRSGLARFKHFKLVATTNTQRGSSATSSARWRCRSLDGD